MAGTALQAAGTPTLSALMLLVDLCFVGQALGPDSLAAAALGNACVPAPAERTAWLTDRSYLARPSPCRLERPLALYPRRERRAGRAGSGGALCRRLWCRSQVGDRRSDSAARAVRAVRGAPFTRWVVRRGRPGSARQGRRHGWFILLATRPGPAVRRAVLGPAEAAAVAVAPAARYGGRRSRKPLQHRSQVAVRRPLRLGARWLGNGHVCVAGGATRSPGGVGAAPPDRAEEAARVRSATAAQIDDR